MWGRPIREYEIPSYDEPGSFGFKRTYHNHEGVDLYCPESTPVYAVENGKLIGTPWFTGLFVQMPWWEDTKCVIVEGESGIVVYGELMPVRDMWNGMPIEKGELIGFVKRVLKKDKGRPMTMLHIELYEHGSEVCHPWEPGKEKPKGLLDPTEYLKGI
jgi:murein DD-endopeptidase MepM/ murein hydrolase activator NlpD